MSALESGWTWLAGRRHSLRGVAVTRIMLGLVVWTQLVVNWPDRHWTWGDGADWTDPIRQARPWSPVLSVLVHTDGWVFEVAYVAAALAGVALMLGWHTRIATVATLLLWMSLYVTNPFVGSGGDAVLRMVLLYLCFTDAGRVWSLDARRRSRDGAPSWLGTVLHNLAVVLIVHQVLMVYVASALWKVQSPRWLDGTATYYPLQTEAYSPWRDVLHPLSSSEPIIAVATWSAIVIQLLFPVMLLYRPTRVLGLVAVTGMHVAIGLLMGILYFSLVMIAVDMILVSDRSWRDLTGWVARRRGRADDRVDRTNRTPELA